MAETRRPGDSRLISGLGPHGEFPASVEQLVVSEVGAATAAVAGFSVALVLHTTRSDWSKLQVAGIRATLEHYQAELMEVVECGFQPERQVASLDRLLELEPDAIISVPVGIVQVADAHRRIGEAGIKLVLMDNAPMGMVAHRDYACVISADNFGNGEVAAEVLAQHIPSGGRVIVLGYDIYFYATNERELGFRRWMRENRPDVTITRAEFEQPEDAGSVVRDLIAANDVIDALFVVWDEPALLAAEAVRQAGRSIPMSTVDLGNRVALEIASDGMIKGAGAQLPYDQGGAEATAAIMALVGDEPPEWVALPALAVTRQNVIEAYEAVWHAKAPGELREALKA